MNCDLLSQTLKNIQKPQATFLTAPLSSSWFQQCQFPDWSWESLTIDSLTTYRPQTLHYAFYLETDTHAMLPAKLNLVPCSKTNIQVVTFSIVSINRWEDVKVMDNSVKTFGLCKRSHNKKKIHRKWQLPKGLLSASLTEHYYVT